MWAVGGDRRNALRMGSNCAIIDPLASVLEGKTSERRRRAREREKDTQQGRQRQKRRWTSIDGSITSIPSSRDDD